jgi:hypothetical protein
MMQHTHPLFEGHPHVDIWNGTARRTFPEIGKQIVFTNLTFGRARLCLGPIDQPYYDYGY